MAFIGNIIPREAICYNVATFMNIFMSIIGIIKALSNKDSEFRKLLAMS